MPENTRELESFLEPLLRQFHTDLGYTGPRPGDNFDGLLRGMHEQARKTGIPYPEGSRSWKAFKVGLFHTYLTYPHQPLEVRIYTAIFTWLATQIDDAAVKSPAEWQHFGSRFLAGERHPSLLAQAWADQLRLTYKYFSPTAANFIVAAGLHFTNTTTLVGSELQQMNRTAGGKSWPYYLREKDGISEAYIWFTFPASVYPDISCFMEAVPDMNKYILLTNDILSFYKEEKAGEKDNYVQARAFYEKADVRSVLQEVAQESLDAFWHTQTVLEGREMYAQAWNDHVMGYVSFHKASGRYGLEEMGLAEEYPYEFAQLASLQRKMQGGL